MNKTYLNKTLKNKKQFVHEIFEELADKYDFMNEIITFKKNSFIKEQAVKKVLVKENFKILDVCTGSGDIAIDFAKISDKSVEIIGIDFSEKMLEIARNKAKNFENITFLQADADHLPFEKDTFDVVFISYGLRNLENTDIAIKELKRVTKKEGCVVNLDLGKPNFFIKIFFKLYMSVVVPILAKIFYGKSLPYKYLFESSKDFSSQEELVSKFKKLGFYNIKNYNYLFGTIAQQIAFKEKD